MATDGAGTTFPVFLMEHRLLTDLQDGLHRFADNVTTAKGKWVFENKWLTVSSPNPSMATGRYFLQTTTSSNPVYRAKPDSDGSILRVTLESLNNEYLVARLETSEPGFDWETIAFYHLSAELTPELKRDRVMETFVESHLIDKRIGEFSSELPPTEEIDEFYSLARISPPSDRPYGWSNTIMSLDGVVSAGQGSKGVKLVGLKNFPKAKARTDFRLLAAGWAYSDAIIFSAASFRAEPDQKLLIPITDLIKFRTNVLNKTTQQPDIVMVTASGWIATEHPAWSTPRRKLIATSKSGLPKLMNNIKSQLNSPGEADSYSEAMMEFWLEEKQITLKCFESTVSDDDVNLMDMAKFLKSDWGINSFDVSAGPTLISLMIKAKVLDECRYTSSGLIAGKNGTGDPGLLFPDDRPQCYPASINTYPVDESPLLEVVGVRLFGPFHVYHRGRWIYRH